MTIAEQERDAHDARRQRIKAQLARDKEQIEHVLFKTNDFVEGYAIQAIRYCGLFLFVDEPMPFALRDFIVRALGAISDGIDPALAFKLRRKKGRMKRQYDDLLTDEIGHDVWRAHFFQALPLSAGGSKTAFSVVAEERNLTVDRIRQIWRVWSKRVNRPAFVDGQLKSLAWSVGYQQGKTGCSLEEAFLSVAQDGDIRKTNHHKNPFDIIPLACNKYPEAVERGKLDACKKPSPQQEEEIEGRLIECGKWFSGIREARRNKRASP